MKRIFVRKNGQVVVLDVPDKTSLNWLVIILLYTICLGIFFFTR